MEKTKTDGIKYYGFYFNGYEWVLEAVQVHGNITKIDVSTSEEHIVNKCADLNKQLAVEREKEKNCSGDPCVDYPDITDVLMYSRTKHGFGEVSDEADLVCEVYNFMRENTKVLI